MQVPYLDSLDRAVTVLLQRGDVRDTITQLKADLQSSPEPFVWASVDCGSLATALPPVIQSAWIFVLKRDTWSGAHFHPNSIQHMVVVEGQGRAKVAGEERGMQPYGGPVRAEAWCVIDKRVPHEFLPQRTDMVVISFHTCPPDELVEIEVGTGESRVYQPRH